MAVLRWREQTRTELAALLPEAVVVLPVGATEQHGPYLPTGTDAFLAEAVCEQALAGLADGAGSGSDSGDTRFLLAPTLPVGASDHHLPFGGTLSLAPQTLLAVLLDLARSVAECGGRRLVVVNGHGGNHGVLHAAGAEAANRYGLAVATTDYWRLLPAADAAAAHVPGHAGEFEVSLMLAHRRDLVRDRPTRAPVPVQARVDGFDLHSRRGWQDIEGYTDQPAAGDAEQGRRLLAVLADALAARLLELARTL